MNNYVKLAKNTIETYIKTGKKIEIPKNLPERFYNEKKGVFVTIYKKSENSQSEKKELRGCIGTFLPIKKNIAQEIIDNAISAATHDYRFSPLAESELEDLQYEVSLLNSPEQIDSTKDLNSKKFGIIIKSQEGKTGLLLPGIEGVKTPKHQISIACQKAGIDLDKERIKLFRFTVEKYK